MSASDLSAETENLQSSIEQLIAESLRRSQSSQDAELVQLKSAMRQAQAEIETAHAAMGRAREALRKALGDDEIDDLVIEVPLVEVQNQPEAITGQVSEVATPAPVPMAEGPHQLDLIAHDVTIGLATGLQAFLRSRPEVTSAQTREFVNGELRLELEMASAPDMDALNAWIGEHQGRIANQTASVIELRFAAN